MIIYTKRRTHYTKRRTHLIRRTNYIRKTIYKVNKNLQHTNATDNNPYYNMKKKTVRLGHKSTVMTRILC